MIEVGNNASVPGAEGLKWRERGDEAREGGGPGVARPCRPG